MHLWRKTVRKLNGLKVVLALAVVALLGNPDTLSAQSLTFSPSTAAIAISGPGATGTLGIVVSSTTVTITSIFPANIGTTSGGNWLSATVTGANTMNVVIQNTSSLSLNTTYSGSIHVQANGNSATDTVLP